MAHASNNNLPNWTILWFKAPRKSRNTKQNDFPWWQCTGTRNEGPSRIGCLLEMEIACSCRLQLTRTGINSLLLICINRQALPEQRISSFGMGKGVDDWFPEIQKRYVPQQIHIATSMKVMFSSRQLLLQRIHLRTNVLKETCVLQNLYQFDKYGPNT